MRHKTYFSYFHILSVIVLFISASNNAFAQSSETVQKIMQVELEKISSAVAERKARLLLYDLGTPVLGNLNGDVSIVEFFDYQCGYCKAAERRIRKIAKEDGNIRVVIKDFPILGTESRFAARAALASHRQGKHEIFHYAMMDHRGQLSIETIIKIAKTVGLDINQLLEDMDSPEIADQIISNFDLARSLKISYTPGFFVDTRVLSGVSLLTSTANIDFVKEVEKARSTK